MLCSNKTEPTSITAQLHKPTYLRQCCSSSPAQLPTPLSSPVLSVGPGPVVSHHDKLSLKPTHQECSSASLTPSTGSWHNWLNRSVGIKQGTREVGAQCRQLNLASFMPEIDPNHDKHLLGLYCSQKLLLVQKSGQKSIAGNGGEYGSLNADQLRLPWVPFLN